MRRYLQPFRSTLVAPPPIPVPPTIRTVTGWLTRRTEDLDKQDTAKLTEIIDRSPVLQRTYEHVREFAKILVNRQGHDLDTWMRQADTTGAPELRSFVVGLRRDLDAVTAGLTLPHSSGAVEGNVTRLKMIKRQMFGRAGFALLRKRVLLMT